MTLARGRFKQLISDFLLLCVRFAILSKTLIINPCHIVHISDCSYILNDTINVTISTQLDILAEISPLEALVHPTGLLVSLSDRVEGHQLEPVAVHAVLVVVEALHLGVVARLGPDVAGELRDLLQLVAGAPAVHGVLVQVLREVVVDQLPVLVDAAALAGLAVAEDGGEPAVGVAGHVAVVQPVEAVEGERPAGLRAVVLAGLAAAPVLAVRRVEIGVVVAGEGEGEGLDDGAGGGEAGAGVGAPTAAVVALERLVAAEVIAV